MIPERIKIPKVEFYITNVCNLTCEDCNRFNNHDFKGWQSWNDYKHIYQQWAKYIEIEKIVILGGEPLLNPTIIDWIQGINEIWDCSLQILTNGTRINHVRGLYEAISKLRLSKKKNWLGISLHNQSELPVLEKEIHKFLKPPVKLFGKNHHLNNFVNSDQLYIDSNSVRVPVWLQDEFTTSAIKLQSTGKFTLHSSDPVQAHDICPIAQHKSYHFIHGKLYKCGPVALFPEFDQQHEFDISTEDRELINNYKPLSVDEFESRGQDFLSTIDNPIPQCKFCPSHLAVKKIVSIRKSIDKQ